MASNIKGITIEIGGNVTPLEKALKTVNSETYSLQKELGEVEKSLKLNPESVVLLEQKQKLLAQSVQAAADKLDVLKNAEKQVQEQVSKGEVSQEQYRKLQREIENTSGKADKYKSDLDKVNNSLTKQNTALGNNSKKLNETSSSVNKASKENLQLNGRLGDVANSLGIKVPQGANESIRSMQGNVIATTALIGVTVKLISSLVNSTVETAKYADEINTLSKVSGVSTDTLQAMNYAGERLDVETNTINASLGKMIKTMTNAAKGGNDASEAYKKMGINVQGTNGELANSEQTFYKVIDYLKTVSNETERDSIAMQVFGKSARELNPLIEAGSQELAKFATEAQQAGYIMDTQTLDKFNGLADSLDVMEKKFDVAKMQMAAGFLPILEGLINTLAKVPPEAITVAATIGIIVVSITTLIKTVSTVVDGVKLIKSAFGMANPAMLKTVVIVMLVVGALILLGLIIATIQGRAAQMEHTAKSMASSINGIMGNVNSVPQYAKGTLYHRGGLAIVGEEGPELVELPTGSKVKTASQTKTALQGGGGENVYNTYHVTVNGIKEYNEFMEMVNGGGNYTRMRGSR